jgi:hypothetical protein
LIYLCDVGSDVIFGLVIFGYDIFQINQCFEKEGMIFSTRERGDFVLAAAAFLH